MKYLKWIAIIGVLLMSAPLYATTFYFQGVAAPAPTPTPAGAVNPANFGAVCDGVTNDFTAFQNAINAGSLYIPVIGTGNCLINPPTGTSAVLVTGVRTIQCAPSVKLLITTQWGVGDNAAMFRFEGPGAKNVNHCIFQGANNITNPTFNTSVQTNFPLEDWCTAAQGGACPLTVDSNTFQGCQGNSCINVYGNDATGPVVGGTITNNLLKGCGLYGITLDSATNWAVSGNTSIDCAEGSEADDIGQQNSNNTYSNETLTCINNIGWNPSVGGVDMFLTGGQAVANFDYSTNVVTGNTLNGSCIKLGEGGTTTTHVAIYTNNTCNGNNPPTSACVNHF